MTKLSPVVQALENSSIIQGLLKELSNDGKRVSIFQRVLNYRDSLIVILQAPTSTELSSRDQRALTQKNDSIKPFLSTFSKLLHEEVIEKAGEIYILKGRLNEDDYYVMRSRWNKKKRKYEVVPCRGTYAFSNSFDSLTKDRIEQKIKELEESLAQLSELVKLLN